MLKVGSASMTVRRQTTMDRSPIESFLHRGLIPAWDVTGIVDWWYHRHSQIERPDHGGAKESLIHSLMLAEAASRSRSPSRRRQPRPPFRHDRDRSRHEAAARGDMALANGSAREVAAGERRTAASLRNPPLRAHRPPPLTASNWPRLAQPGGNRRSVAAAEAGACFTTCHSSLSMTTRASGRPPHS